MTGAPGRNRTCDRPLRRRLLYPLSYRRLNLHRASYHKMPLRDKARCASGVLWQGCQTDRRPAQGEGRREPNLA